MPCDPARTLAEILRAQVWGVYPTELIKWTCKKFLERCFGGRLEITDALALQTQTGSVLYPMLRGAAVCCWSDLLVFVFFSLEGKIFSMSDNPSLDSVDSEYDMGSVQRDLNFLEDNPSLKDIMLANPPSPRMTSPFISLRPANPAMQALSSQKREAHNRSPVSFREGRRASDTSLTQGDRPLSPGAPNTLWL